MVAETKLTIVKDLLKNFLLEKNLQPDDKFHEIIKKIHNFYESDHNKIQDKYNKLKKEVEEETRNRLIHLHKPKLTRARKLCERIADGTYVKKCLPPKPRGIHYWNATKKKWVQRESEHRQPRRQATRIQAQASGTSQAASQATSEPIQAQASGTSQDELVDDIDWESMKLDDFF